jgi:hypothetical protein
MFGHLLRADEGGEEWPRSEESGARWPRPSLKEPCTLIGHFEGTENRLRYLWIAAVQLRTTVSDAAPLDCWGLASTRNRCPSSVTA